MRVHGHENRDQICWFNGIVFFQRFMKLFYFVPQASRRSSGTPRHEHVSLSSDQDAHNQHDILHLWKTPDTSRRYYRHGSFTYCISVFGAILSNPPAITSNGV